MCFIGLNIKNIAKEDVKVEKFAFQRLSNQKILSPFYLTEWEIGETKAECLHKTIWRGVKIEITRGLHSGEKISVVNDRNKSDVYICSKISPKVAIMSFHKEDLLNFNVKPIICECIIPKGAIYYQNDYGEFVSNSLKIVSIKDI